jgi:hypothetical protein
MRAEPVDSSYFNNDRIPNQKKDIGQKKKDIGEWVIGQMVIAEPADSYGLLDNRAV